MKGFLVKILGVFVLAVMAAVFIHLSAQADAYVIVYWGGTAVQMSLFVSIVIWILITLLVIAFVGLLQGLLGGWRRSWLQQQHSSRLRRGLNAYASSNWKEAFELLKKVSTVEPDEFGLAWLSARAGAQCLSFAKLSDKEKLDIESRLDNLGARFAQYPVQACLIAVEPLIARGEFDSAKAKLTQLSHDAQHHTDVLLCKMRLAEAEGQWTTLVDLREQLVRQSAPKAPARPGADLDIRMLRGALSDDASVPRLVHIAEILDKVPSTSAMHHSGLIADLAKQLAIRGQSVLAERVVRHQLQTLWSESLVLLYGEIEGKSTKAQIKTAEKWLLHYGQSDALKETLKKLAIRQGDQARIERYSG